MGCELSTLSQSEDDSCGAGLDLKVQVRIEVSGDGRVSAETLGRLNTLLQEVSGGLKVQ